MNAIVQSLAAMSGLRSRSALDAELLQLIIAGSEGAAVGASLIRLVGDAEDLRCLRQASVCAGQSEVQRSSVGGDLAALPSVADFPLRQQVLARHSPVYAESPSLGCVLPLLSPQGVWGMLEIELQRPLAAPLAALVEGVVINYNNLLGLLDYGEKDALTELLNRKTFDGAFFQATTESHPSNGTCPDSGVWLAVLDIDHFKRVNDNFGHLIGDEVLLLLARLMRSSFRFHDQLYRFGGEEFVVLMHCDNAEHAHMALERFRLKVQTHAFPQVGSITVSIGYSTLLPSDTPSAAFGRADKAVYFAKEHGRNQVCSYQQLVAEGALAEQVIEDMDVDLF